MDISNVHPRSLPTHTIPRSENVCSIICATFMMSACALTRLAFFYSQQAAADDTHVALQPFARTVCGDEDMKGRTSVVNGTTSLQTFKNEEINDLRMMMQWVSVGGSHHLNPPCLLCLSCCRVYQMCTQRQGSCLQPAKFSFGCSGKFCKMLHFVHTQKSSSPRRYPTIQCFCFLRSCTEARPRGYQHATKRRRMWSIRQFM